MQVISHTFETSRHEIIDRLLGYLREDTALPQSLFIYGSSGTGKTKIIASLLRQTIPNAIIVNCIECCSSKVLFETILNGIFNHKLSAANQYSPYVRCTNARDFFDALQHCDTSQSYVIMIDAAEKLGDMDKNILPIFLRLQELSDLNICCVLVSTLHIQMMTPTDGLEGTISIYWPQYSKKEILTIMMDKFEDHQAFVKKKLVSTNPSNVSDLEAIVDSMHITFFENYLHLFLNVTLQSCRNVRELLLTSRDCFQKYCEPVLNGSVDINDVQKLYRNIAEVLKSAMKKTYQSIEDSNETTSELDTSRMQQLELPFYAKYLLIAAFLASHNDAKLDKRLYMKNHGKQRKRVQDIKAKAVVNEKLSTQLGPKSFNLDRLFAIFYAIIDEKINMNCNLMSQIPSLVRLKLLTYVAGENNVMDGNARLQCNAGLDLIIKIGKSVGFNVSQHLCDFM
ncbi:Origin recognition complex subunit 5 [Pseudolycoriella hygida]|uniref:Origin recognition complex subunit 5 n=1 Tax=Pseudolycoriella hygida TaxID=35572 RepID=A0A9Q0MPJ8_9DIPT|nr:Origin recognition complex subunit 5 [Pseudolycoriella hygida]